MSTYEYKHLEEGDFKGKGGIEDWNELGAAGWKLMHVYPGSGPDREYFRWTKYLLMRKAPKKDKAEPHTKLQPMTSAQFFIKTGYEPQLDDLERVNCDKVGHDPHTACGWCRTCDRPAFECGHQGTRMIRW